jgi:hypothetical protein
MGCSPEFSTGYCRLLRREPAHIPEKVVYRISAFCVVSENDMRQ